MSAECTDDEQLRRNEKCKELIHDIPYIYYSEAKRSYFSFIQLGSKRLNASSCKSLFHLYLAINKKLKGMGLPARYDDDQLKHASRYSCRPQKQIPIPVLDDKAVGKARDDICSMIVLQNPILNKYIYYSKSEHRFVISYCTHSAIAKPENTAKRLKTHEINSHTIHLKARSLYDLYTKDNSK
jgi:hypothetical protein